ncbi:MAG: hypothetical protein PHD21_02915 [Flavobacteriales bacterium]|nr:hypothetical protein [Flavobacteriales bacterium]
MKKLILSILLFFCFCSSWGQTDSTHITQKNMEMSLPWRNFSSVYNASAVGKYYLYQQSFTDISAEYKSRNEENAYSPQNGDGESIFDLSARSFQEINASSHVWGGANYQNGEIKNILWNSTADYSLLYPYIMADTIGGGIKHEKYSFYGGYSHVGDKISWGAEIDFSAQHQYRQADPRPRNISSDLHIGLGIGYDISKGHILSLSTSLRIYRQTNNVTFYNELGIKPEYNMSGLGSYLSRFSGDVTSIYYKGIGYAFNLSYFPKDKKGFSTYVQYRYFAFDRIALGLNDLPLTLLSRHNILYEASYLFHRNKWHYGVGISATHTTSYGQENIVGDPSSSVYPILGSLDMYQSNVSVATANGFVSYLPNERHILTLAPQIGIEHSAEKYTYPSKKMNTTNAIGSLGIKYSTHGKRTFYSVNLINSYRSNIEKELSIPVANMETWTINMVNYQYWRESGNYYRAALDFAVKYAVKKTYALSFSGKYSLTSYSLYGKSHYGNISVGIIF